MWFQNFVRFSKRKKSLEILRNVATLLKCWKGDGPLSTITWYNKLKVNQIQFLCGSTYFCYLHDCVFKLHLGKKGIVPSGLSREDLKNHFLQQQSGHFSWRKNWIFWDIRRSGKKKSKKTLSWLLNLNCNNCMHLEI